MQKLFLIAALLSISNILLAQKDKLSFYELDVINGLFYQPNTIAPFSGTAVDFHEKGKKKLQVPIKDGKVHGTVREWAKNGKKIHEANYVQGVQEGAEVQWFATGKKKLEINFENGLASGMCTEWYKNGQKKSEGSFLAGKEEGEHHWWYSTGGRDQWVNYKNGRPESAVKNWHQNGQLSLESHYKNGQQHGPTIEWYDGGQKKSESHFKLGKEHGESRYWLKDGRLLAVQEYDNGQLVKDINYRSGNVRLADGFAEVYNGEESFFLVRINGGKVLYRPGEVITYVVDGQLLQLYITPLTSFVEEKEGLSEEELLAKYQAFEATYISENTGHTIAPQQELLHTSADNPFLFWQFDSPTSQAEGKELEERKKVLREYYASMIVGQQVLSLYSVLTKANDPQQIEALLKRLAGQVEEHPSPIDLNEIAR